jgi:hypothetical protein
MIRFKVRAHIITRIATLLATYKKRWSRDNAGRALFLLYYAIFTLQYQVRGFAPIGTLEFWNIGILGSGIVEWWV